MQYQGAPKPVGYHQRVSSAPRAASRFGLLAIFVVLLIVSSCNRPVNKLVTEQQPAPTTQTDVPRPNPQPIRAPRVEPTPAQPLDEDELLVEETRISEHLRPKTTPPFTIDSLTGEKIPTLLVELKETGCLQDTCPDFTIQLLADYTFRYIGRANVDLLGEFTGKAEFNPLLKVGPLTSKVGFFKMNETYPVTAQNIGVYESATTIYVDHRGRNNRVTEVKEAPAGFQELEAEILSWVERVIWTPLE